MPRVPFEFRFTCLELTLTSAGSAKQCAPQATAPGQWDQGQGGNPRASHQLCEIPPGLSQPSHLAPRHACGSILLLQPPCILLAATASLQPSHMARFAISLQPNSFFCSLLATSAHRAPSYAASPAVPTPCGCSITPRI